MRLFSRGALLSVVAVVSLGAGCQEQVQDAKVATLYVGQGADVTKKLGDADGTIYDQLQLQTGSRAVDNNLKILSTVEFHLLTYVATKIVARDALGGANLDRVRVFRENIPPDPAEMVGEFVASISSNPALAVSGGDLFVVWMGRHDLRRVTIKRSGNATSWRDAGEFLLAEPLGGIDIAPFGNNLLLGGFQNGSVVVYEIRLSPPGPVEKFTIFTFPGFGGMKALGQVSLAIRNDTVLVLFGFQPTLSVGQPCNVGNACRSQTCTQGLCAGSDPPPHENPGFVRMFALSLSGATRGNKQSLWSSVLIPDLQWVSGARITEASDEPAPNDYIVAAFRGHRGGGPEIFLCKWPWPTGAAPDWVLSPQTCPQFLELNDENLQILHPIFDINADRFVRQRRD